jgi:hypothetical protein
MKGDRELNRYLADAAVICTTKINILLSLTEENVTI